MAASFPASLFTANKSVQIYAGTNMKQISIVDNTTFRIDAGSNTDLGIKEIIGYIF